MGPTTPPAGVPFTGVVLCGGSSTRMGRDKALLEVDGVALAVRVAAALRAAGATEVLALGGDGPGLGALGLEVRPDDRPGAGPLAATIAALTVATEAVVMVAACDLVDPTSSAIVATVRALVDHPEALGAVPEVDGHRQWVHVAWDRRAVEVLAAAYERGDRSLRRAAATLPLVDVAGIDARSLADADRPADLPAPGGGSQVGR